MKCDELTPVTREYADEYWADRFAMVYNADEVDAAIAELKDIIDKNQSAYYVDLGIVAKDCEKLKAENERLVKCCKEYDSRQRIDERLKFNGAQQLRATKRALWLARAERAKEMCRRLLIQGFDPKWEEVERKCRAKAEKYK